MLVVVVLNKKTEARLQKPNHLSNLTKKGHECYKGVREFRKIYCVCI